MRPMKQNRVGRAVFSLCFVALGLMACGGPTVKEAATDFFGTFCAKLRTCNTAGFDKAFKDNQACVDKALSGIPEDTSDKRSACDDDEVATCQKDVEALDCNSELFTKVDTTKLPASCQKC